MRTPLRLGLFALGLVAVFAVSFGVGRVAGPTASAEESHGMGSEQGDPAPGGHGSVELPGGLQIAQDGYRLELLTPSLSTDETLPLRLRGTPVTDLQPYLAAYGHLVALRDGDLAYLHVHPDGHPDDGRTSPGPQIAFHVEVPSAGSYRLFLDFQHRGEVRTAAFTVVTAPATTSSGGHG